MSDLTDSSCSLSDEELGEPKRKKIKTSHMEGRATKESNQEYFPYVANNDNEIKNAHKSHPKNQSSYKQIVTLNESKDITFTSNYASNSYAPLYLNDNAEVMKSDVGAEKNIKRPFLEVISDSDSRNDYCSKNRKRSKTDYNDGNSYSKINDSDPNATNSKNSDDRPSEAYTNYGNNVQISNKGMSLMKKIGYKEGKGLGKNAQGVVDPVQLSTQKDRKGLGFTSQSPRESFVLDWDSDQKESTEILKVTDWLQNENPLLFSIDNMSNWVQTGEKERLSDNKSTEFADPEIFKLVNSSKNVLDNINDHDYRHGRSKANPFETIKNGIFQNRAAMKMANIDWACDYMFTDPKNSDGSSMLSSNSSLLYFADICAGPGGFSEYVLWRKSWRAKGVGFTLRNSNDFKLDDFYAGSPESFEAYYGHDGDGDIYKPQNITSLEKFATKMTEGKGVHFVMADGGFSVEGQENLQEIMSKRLYLCQAIAALSILRPGGHFMCKLFDIFTEFSAGLLFLLYHCFKQISIYKPVTSRPANSERYIICKWRLDNINDIKNYLSNVNSTWNELGPKEDVISIVPLHVVKTDSKFFKYLWESNNKLGRIQALSLSKTIAYTKDKRLADERQKDLRKKCLELWNVKDGVRCAPFRTTPQNAINSLVVGRKDFLQSFPEVFTQKNVQKHVKSVHDWHCVLLNNSKAPTFFLSLEGSQVYEFVENQWATNQYLKNVTMSPGTLIYGELATELEGENLGQLRVKVLHIIDAYKLGNIDISNKHYLSRVRYCINFAKSMNKIESNKIKIRVKEPVYLKNINSIFEKFDLRWSKYHRKNLKMFMLDSKKYCWASGMLFIKATSSPWVRALSRTYNSMYYGHPTQKPIYEAQNPVAAYASFSKCCLTNKMCHWMDEYGNQLQTPSSEQQLDNNYFEQFLKRFL